MTELSTALDSELAKDHALIFGALKIELPSYTLRLLDGSSELTFGAEAYLGEDPTYGVWGGVEGLDDGAGDQAAAFNLTLYPPDGAAAADLADPSFQGSAVTIFVGAVDRETGAVIADPYGYVIAELDVPRLITDKNSRELDYSCISAFERFFETDEGARLSEAFHKAIYPGETGFDNITAVTRKDGWGVADGNGTAAGGTGSPYGHGGGARNSGIKPSVVAKL